MFEPTTDEVSRRKAVLEAICEAVGSNTTIRLQTSQTGKGEANKYKGRVGTYTYLFEGEDDLLHLAVTRRDGSALSAEEGQAVAAFLLEGVPAGLVWIRPGEFSQHFYCGHDDLVAHVKK